MPALLARLSLYAIRHRPSGLFMPQLSGGRSYTALETQVWKPVTKARLFHTRPAALSALRAWGRGVWVPVYETSDWDGRQVRIGAEPPTAASGRRVEELEIVEYDCTEIMNPFSE